MDEIKQSFIDRWQFTRNETLEILENLTGEQMQFRPEGEHWQPLSYQFACCARTQLIYAKAVREGKMNFGWFGSQEFPSKVTFTTKGELRSLLDEADQAWLDALKNAAADAMVVWPDFSAPLVLHISNLLEHERMHLGQLISYHTMAQYELPPNFKRNWAL
jgi:hypothetical protein